MQTEIENLAKCPPRPDENVVFENHQMPEMVRRHRITETIQNDFENSYDFDKFMGLSIDEIDEAGAEMIEEVKVPENYLQELGADKDKSPPCHHL